MLRPYTYINHDNFKAIINMKIYGNNFKKKRKHDKTKRHTKNPRPREKSAKCHHNNAAAVKLHVPGCNDRRSNDSNASSKYSRVSKRSKVKKKDVNSAKL